MDLTDVNLYVIPKCENVLETEILNMTDARKCKTLLRW